MEITDRNGLSAAVTDPVVRVLGLPTTCTARCRTIYPFQDQVPAEAAEDYSCYVAGNKEWKAAARRRRAAE